MRKAQKRRGTRRQRGGGLRQDLLKQLNKQIAYKTNPKTCSKDSLVEIRVGEILVPGLKEGGMNGLLGMLQDGLAKELTNEGSSPFSTVTKRLGLQQTASHVETINFLAELTNYGVATRNTCELKQLSKRFNRMIEDLAYKTNTSNQENSSNLSTGANVYAVTSSIPW